MKAIYLQPHESAPSQRDSVALGTPGAGPARFHPAERLESAMAVLERPGPLGPLEPGECAHLQVAAGPVLHVAVWGDEPKPFGPAVAHEAGARPALGAGCVARRAALFPTAYFL